MIENVTDSRVAPEKSEAAGAPAGEIEITPEMIVAGATELARYRYEDCNEREVVAAIYRSMTAEIYRHQ